MLKYLEKSRKSDNNEIENYKKEIISNLSGKTKEDIVPKVKKLTLWQRIKKVLNF
jgi:hypothetical protein